MTTNEMRQMISKIDPNLSLKDIGFAILHIVTESAYQAYRMIFDINISAKSGLPRLMAKRPNIIQLEKAIRKEYFTQGSDSQSDKNASETILKNSKKWQNIDLESISEDEINSEYIQKLLFTELKNLGNIRASNANRLSAKEYADLTARITDITLKLNKLKGDEPIDNARVIVYHKYNDICPYCHHEIAVDRRTEEEKQKDDERYEKLFGIQDGD